MIDPLFMIHNSHLADPDLFKQTDPQLRILRQQPYVHMPLLLKKLPKDIPGIYTITGGRQIGKTTLSKQWMDYLLKCGVKPQAMAYFTGEVIVDHFSLIRQLQNYLPTMPQDEIRYLIIDEVTYILNWDLGIKFLADLGLFEQVVLLITGSDLILIQEARMRFPGRRGRASQVDFHMYPLSFYETLTLMGKIENLDVQLQEENPRTPLMETLYQAFGDYLKHGGYLTAINNYASQGMIEKYVLDTYADWIRGDVVKQGKSEHYCRSLFTAMCKHLSSQVTWNTLAKEFTIEHHGTVADYAALLASMDAIFIQEALVEDKLVGAIKKAKKLTFTDPFIYHAIYGWLYATLHPYQEQILPALADPIITSYLVEGCVVNHIRRHYPTYYIKAEGEVDLAYIHNKKFYPIEIKWTTQMRIKDLKQILKYPNGVILGKEKIIRNINTTPSYPLPWYLARAGLPGML